MTLIEPSDAAYVIVDLETTGLEVDYDVPLELGIGIFDEDLNELTMNSWFIKPDGWREQLSGNPYVEKMHTVNGLISDLNALPDFYFQHWRGKGTQRLDFSVAMVSMLVWDWLTETCGIKADTLPMTGSSIGSLDRPFMRKYLPVAAGFFTYRSIDVSSIKELCKRHNTPLYNEMKLRPEFLDTNKKHRVRDDVRQTAKELKFYLENFLRVQPREVTVVGQMELPVLDHPV